MPPIYRVTLEELKTPVRVRLGDYRGAEYTAANPLPTTATLTGPVTVAILGVSTAANQVLEIAKLETIRVLLNTIAGYTQTLVADMTLTSFAVDFNADMATLLAELQAIATNVEDTRDFLSTMVNDNPALSFVWSSGMLTKLFKTVAGTTYSGTVTWTAGKLDSIGAWIP